MPRGVVCIQVFLAGKECKEVVFEFTMLAHEWLSRVHIHGVTGDQYRLWTALP